MELEKLRLFKNNSAGTIDKKDILSLVNASNQSSSQRQLMLSIAATSEQINTNLPINLCLVLDHSGSMQAAT